jgi:hypothetical protein
VCVVRRARLTLRRDEFQRGRMMLTENYSSVIQEFKRQGGRIVTFRRTRRGRGWIIVLWLGWGILVLVGNRWRRW